MTQGMTIEARRVPGGRRPVQCPCFLFGAKGSGTGQGIRQRLPFRCNKTKTSGTVGWRSPWWSPGRRHRQSLWQARTNFSQDKCTICSPSKWPIVGAVPAQYLGRGPGPLTLYIGLATIVERGGIWHLKLILPKGQHHCKNTPREDVLPLYCSPSAPEAIHTLE